MIEVKEAAETGKGVFATAKAGQKIYTAFMKMPTNGDFVSSYAETYLGSKTNHSNTPNAHCVITRKGIDVIADIDINGEQVLCDYQQLLDLFPEDASIRKLIVIPK